MVDSAENSFDNNFVTSFAKRMASSDIELIKEYIRITDASKKGENVSSYDFTYVQEQYNTQQVGLRKEFIRATLDLDFAEYLKISNEIDKEKSKIVKSWENDNYVDKYILHDDLNKIFQQQYNFPPKNLNVPDNSTPQELVATLLQNNSGISIGEDHTSKVATKFIADNMALFKKSGVDTIYLERDNYRHIELESSSVDELRQKLKDRTLEEKLAFAKGKANTYRVEQADDVNSEEIKMYIAAKENGIRIVNIDIKGHARDINEARIGVTNFTWTQEIAADRISKAEGEKFIVFGGKAHFTPVMLSNGMVDDFLGTPVLAFDNRPETSPILKGRDFAKNAADFYIAGGECTLDTKQFAKAQDIFDDARKSIFSSTVSQLLDESLKLSQNVKLECSDISKLEPLVPTYIPSPAPNSGGQSPALDK